jgi:hypothetical protein
VYRYSPPWQLLEPLEPLDPQQSLVEVDRGHELIIAFLDRYGGWHDSCLSLGTQAVDGLARWFGVRGDTDELMYRQQQYNHTRSQTIKRRNSKVTNNQSRTLDFALEDDGDDSDSDHEYDADKQGVLRFQPSWL